LAVAYAPRPEHSRVYCFLDGPAFSAAAPAGSGTQAAPAGKPDPNYRPAGVWSPLFGTAGGGPVKSGVSISKIGSAFFEGGNVKKMLLQYLPDKDSGEGKLFLVKENLSVLLLFLVPADIQQAQLQLGDSAPVPLPAATSVDKPK
jgi:hypothetical protein